MFASFASKGGAEVSILAFEPAEKRGEGVGGRAGRGRAFRGGGVLKGKREGVCRPVGETEGGERDVRHRV